jgi:hypothetical protein
MQLCVKILIINRAISWFLPRGLRIILLKESGTEEKSREHFSFFRDVKNKNICFRQFGGHQRVIIRCVNQQNANFVANTDKTQKFVRIVVSPRFQNLGDILPHLIHNNLLCTRNRCHNFWVAFPCIIDFI